MKKLAPGDVYNAVRTPTVFTRDGGDGPKFSPGDTVSGRNLHPRGHTRLPAYARNRTGTVEKCYGYFVFPDTMARGLGDHPQYLYNVKFSTRELFGDIAEDNGCVYLDMWESYLEEASR